MDFGIKDRVALVAAASKGIGFAAARELALESARVFLCSQDEKRARASYITGVTLQVDGGWVRSLL